MKKFPLEHLFNMILHGKYSFSEFINCDLAKEYSKILVKSRTIYAPSNKLKSFHHFLSMAICEQLEVNDEVVFSYRKGVSTLDAVKAHQDNKYFFQTDIKSFYSSINHALVYKTILRNKNNLPISDIDDYLDCIVNYISIDDVLPTGFSTSPLVSNSILLDFDNEFNNFCEENGLTYTRYSDDLIISSKYEIKSFITSKIDGFLKYNYGNSFHLNKYKSRYSHTGNKVKILGMVVLPNGEITIDKKQKKEIEVLLHFYREDKNRFRDIIGDDLDKGMARISGILSYIKDVDEAYLHKLMTKYGVTVVETLMRKAV